ncbi:hypothetical protein MM236_12530 [Belliella sp. DSM 107340]|uniref:Lipoprotein n=1 Tax=Belliella calami TaxID=2923436 RepID=A0ABS9UQC2_9BACT|nr:hypothetical protein [Belliella calami]MCH7398822.1 hypothetical protein [Belliella calami]
MITNFKKTLPIYFLGFFLLTALYSCEDELVGETQIYSNDFSQLDLRNFNNSRLFVFENDTIMGFYHNEEVWVKLFDIPPHNAIKITIDVLAHDTWDGNLDDGVSGPDYWYFKIDDEEVYRTTFSNSVCESTYCLRQSFPDEFIKQNFPKEGALATNIPGLCSQAGVPNQTTKYSITKTFRHFKDSLKITMGDELMQTNAFSPLCDESWSISKIEVSALAVR